jgi:hypothetical protein
MIIHIGLYFVKLEMNMVAIKGKKALNQVITQSMSIIDKRQLVVNNTIVKVERE